MEQSKHSTSESTMAPNAPPIEDQRSEYDPTFLHSRREAIIIFSAWLAGLIWAVPYCYINGYSHAVDPANLPTIWGIPSWLFWGIFAPWIVADLFTTWFCFFYLKDDDLGETQGIEDDASGANEMMSTGGETVS